MSGYEGIPMGDLTDSPPPSPVATAETTTTTTTTTPNTSTSTASTASTTSSKKRGREPDPPLCSSQPSTSSSSSAPSPASQPYFPPPPPQPSFPPLPPSLPPYSSRTKASANNNNNNYYNNNNNNKVDNEDEGISFKEACGLLTTHFENRNYHLSEFFRAAGGTPCGDWEGAIELLWYERGVMRWQPEPEGWPLWSHNHLHYCTYTEMEGIALGSVAVWEGEEEGEIW